MRGRLIIAVAVAFAAAGSAHAATVFVVTGRGWGHGVGMSQWGAYGYARHGWSWQRILAHYYPGTHEGSTANVRVRLLLGASQPDVEVGCSGGFRVADATGRSYAIRPGVRRLTPALKVKIGKHPPRSLPSPIAFYCGAAPLLWNGRAYHGVLVVRSRGGLMSVVNALDLEDYLRGVVGGEMPKRWSLAALEAQAVAARSYALATLNPSRNWDLFADTRDQEYGGIGFESQSTDLAVFRTEGRILTWDGQVARTYFFSTSGGRTADVRDVWPRLGAIPYLRSVADPYDNASPRHVWHPRTLSAQLLAARLGVPAGPVRVVRNASERVSTVQIGSTTIDGVRFMRELNLPSTWFSVGTLTIDGLRNEIVYGSKTGIVATANGVAGALLQRLTPAGWETVKAVPRSARVAVQPTGYTIYRLAAPGIRGPEVAVSVAPAVHVAVLSPAVLSGDVAPRTRGAVTVWREVGGAWRIVAHPTLDPHGSFETPLRLRAGLYRVTVDAAGPLGAATKNLHVTPRLLASLKR